MLHPVRQVSDSGAESSSVSGAVTKQHPLSAGGDGRVFARPSVLRHANFVLLFPSEVLWIQPSACGAIADLGSSLGPVTCSMGTSFPSEWREFLVMSSKL